ncbi:MAG: AI-2E family transporter [Bacteroidetes bacterium]|nr:AI-2E family transporter [Bacteroidota bacterium]
MIAKSSSLLRKLLILYLVFAGLHYARSFLMPLTISTVLATLFLPFCKWLESHKVPRGLAAFICLLILVLFGGGVGWLLGWEISQLTGDITELKRKILEVSHGFQTMVMQYTGLSAERQSEMIKNQESSLSDFIPIMAGSLLYTITNTILSLVYIFFLLYYRDHIRRFLMKLAPMSQQTEMTQIIQGAARVSQQYLVGLAKMIACLWVMYSIGFGILGVHHFLFFAILCGLLEIVPFIGNITGTTLTILISSVEGASLPMLAGIACVYGTVQFFQGWVLEPLIVGPQVKINPLFTIIAVVVGELVWGIPGIFLAIPITAMFKIISDHIEHLKPYGFLIGDIEATNKQNWLTEKIENWRQK